MCYTNLVASETVTIWNPPSILGLVFRRCKHINEQSDMKLLQIGFMFSKRHQSANTWVLYESLSF